jgi:curved DNA-binding protein CbpA
VKDDYDILRVSPDAEPELIDAAHRRLERRYQPDVYAEADAAERIRELDETWASTS